MAFQRTSGFGYYKSGRIIWGTFLNELYSSIYWLRFNDVFRMLTHVVMIRQLWK